MMKKDKEKEKYERPETKLTQVTLEEGFMKASVMDPEDQHDKGLTIEEHGFADPTKQWEGDYHDSEWD